VILVKYQMIEYCTIILVIPDKNCPARKKYKFLRHLVGNDESILLFIYQTLLLDKSKETINKNKAIEWKAAVLLDNVQTAPT
ncbi:MAG: hypothetical protein ACLTXM_22785, partial [Enterococcus sp.]